MRILLLTLLSSCESLVGVDLGIQACEAYQMTRGPVGRLPAIAAI
jgi:hypothetical protein